MEQKSECTFCVQTQQPGWRHVPWFVYRRGTPEEVRFCLAHALLGVCPNEGCGASVMTCHLTACGDCRPVNPTANDIAAMIYDREGEDWDKPPDSEHSQCIFCYAWFHPNVIEDQVQDDAGVILSACGPCLAAAENRRALFDRYRSKA